MNKFNLAVGALDEKLDIPDLTAGPINVAHVVRMISDAAALAEISTIEMSFEFGIFGSIASPRWDTDIGAQWLMVQHSIENQRDQHFKSQQLLDLLYVFNPAAPIVMGLLGPTNRFNYVSGLSCHYSYTRGGTLNLSFIMGHRYGQNLSSVEWSLRYNGHT